MKNLFKSLFKPKTTKPSKFVEFLEKVDEFDLIPTPQYKNVGEINRFIVKSLDEFIGLFNDLDPSYVEEFLNIQFAYKGGSFEKLHSYRANGKDEPEGWELDNTVYKTFDSSIIPTKFPCLVFLSFSNKVIFPDGFILWHGRSEVGFMDWVE